MKGFIPVTTSIVSSDQELGSMATTKPRLGSIKFDMFMIILTSWFVGGLHLDGWAHSHIPQLETFFTPWHAVLYSGYSVCAILIVAVVGINHLRGYTWRESVPAG